MESRSIHEAASLHIDWRGRIVHRWAFLLFWAAIHDFPSNLVPAEPAKVAKQETPSPTSTPLPSPPALNPNLSQQETHDEKLRMIFSHSINFYGRVGDEKGVPVEGARVRYSVPSSFSEIQKGTVEGPVTDAKGMFSITGKRGAGIYVSVSHPGYYETDQSYRQFSYFENTADNPTPTSPAEFVLRRKGTAEPLLKLKQVVRSLPKDGRPVQVGLTGDKAEDMTLSSVDLAAAGGRAQQRAVRMESPRCGSGWRSCCLQRRISVRGT